MKIIWAHPIVKSRHSKLYNCYLNFHRSTSQQLNKNSNRTEKVSRTFSLISDDVHGKNHVRRKESRSKCPGRIIYEQFSKRSPPAKTLLWGPILIYSKEDIMELKVAGYMPYLFSIYQVLQSMLKIIRRLGIEVRN